LIYQLADSLGGTITSTCDRPIDAALVLNLVLAAASISIVLIGFKESMKQGISMIVLPPCVLYYALTRLQRCVSPC